MTTVKHTPGPWLAYDPQFENFEFAEIVTDQEAKERKAEEFTNSNIRYVYVPLKQATAAPELLLALEHVQMYFNDWPCKDQLVHDRVINAIKKATE